MGQPYEQLLRTQFEKFCEFVHTTVAAAAAQAYMLHAEGYPAPSSEGESPMPCQSFRADGSFKTPAWQWWLRLELTLPALELPGVPTPLPTPSTHVLLVIFEFDLGEKDLRRQFNFVGASLAPITEMQRRDRGACNQVISKPEPGTFTRQWLDNTVGMARLPPNAPRLPIAFEAHFARSTWRATGGPSFTAHYTGMSASLVLPPGLSFPTPPPQKDYVKHLGDRLHDMKDPEYEKKQQVAAAAVKQKYYYAAMTAPGGAEIMQLNRVWEWRASHQRFYGMASRFLTCMWGLYAPVDCLDAPA